MIFSLDCLSFIHIFKFEILKGKLMTINSVSNQRTVEQEKPPMTVQMELQKDVMKQAMDSNGLPNKLLQMMATAQPPQQTQQTPKNAQEQLSKGYLDVKV